MSDSTTRRMIAAYLQMAEPTLFLSGFFQSPPQNFHSSEEVELDIIRGEEEVSIVLTDLSTGYRFNATDLYTNKSFKPPIHKEAVAINAFDLIQRMAGENPFVSPDFRGNVITRIFSGIRQSENKIRRSIELQASQVLQTGIVTLTDSAGVALFTLDFGPKATHFVTVGTAWSAAGAPLDDIRAISEVIRDDGKADPDQLIMGVDAWEAFIQNDDVQKRYDNRRIDQGTIAPMQMRGNGGSFRGVVEVGNYRYDIWTYGGRFKDAQTGVSTQYLTPANCIVRASGGRLDATFGAIPNIGASLGVQGTALLPELPSRISGGDQNIDLFLNAWLSNDGEQLFAGVGARPLMIPTAIDTYGTLDTLSV